MNYKMTPAQVQSAIREKLSHIYGVSAKNASDDEFYKASALVVRDLLVRGRDEFVHEAEKQEMRIRDSGCTVYGSALRLCRPIWISPR